MSDIRFKSLKSNAVFDIKDRTATTDWNAFSHISICNYCWNVWWTPVWQKPPACLTACFNNVG